MPTEYDSTDDAFHATDDDSVPATDESFPGLAERIDRDTAESLERETDSHGTCVIYLSETPSPRDRERIRASIFDLVAHLGYAPEDTDEHVGSWTLVARIIKTISSSSDAGKRVIGVFHEFKRAAVAGSRPTPGLGSVSTLVDTLKAYRSAVVCLNRLLVIKTSASDIKVFLLSPQQQAEIDENPGLLSRPPREILAALAAVRDARNQTISAAADSNNSFRIPGRNVTPYDGGKPEPLNE